jgi:Acetyl-coenzyme A transporter 1
MKIADKSIGGTYLTLLNTIANFGGTWPSSPILFLVDKFTRIDCVDSKGKWQTRVRVRKDEEGRGEMRKRKDEEG